ncbi:MAG: GntR family transcriptional regulator [Pseudomonadota bacterium]
MTDILISDLESDIIFGVFGSGARLVEDRVMDRYGAKRHAVRAAFTELERRGLLVHRANRGVEVVDFTPDEVDELYEVRIVLETAAARQTPLPVQADILVKLKELAAQHEAAANESDFRLVFTLNKQFHELQFSTCGNTRLMTLIEEHARVAQTVRVVKYHDADHMRTVVEQHHQIIAAMAGANQEAYVQATFNHLPASAEEYRKTYETRFGLKRTA